MFDILFWYLFFVHRTPFPFLVVFFIVIKICFVNKKKLAKQQIVLLKEKTKKRKQQQKKRKEKEQECESYLFSFKQPLLKQKKCRVQTKNTKKDKEGFVKMKRN